MCIYVLVESAHSACCCVFFSLYFNAINICSILCNSYAYWLGNAWNATTSGLLLNLFCFFYSGCYFCCSTCIILFLFVLCLQIALFDSTWWCLIIMRASALCIVFEVVYFERMVWTHRAHPTLFSKVTRLFIVWLHIFEIIGHSVFLPFSFYSTHTITSPKVACGLRNSS